MVNKKLLFFIPIAMTNIQISNPKIHCTACEKLIKMSLNKLPGVKDTSVDLNAKTVSVEFDDKQISKEKIQSAVQTAL